jgi:hypothetical protein
MNPDRAIAMILGLSLAVVLALGLWLLRRTEPASPPPPSPAIGTPTVPPTVGPTRTPAAAAIAARGYRLAGTVVGDLSYAIIEGPNGVNQLYRPGQIIPDIGEVIAIEADRIRLAGSDGDIVLQLAPGPTTTPAPRATETAASEPEPDTTPVRRPRRGRSESESLP